MNILWDLRLFSFGYGSRGAGRFTEALTKAIIECNDDFRIFAWGDKTKFHNSILENKLEWIPYRISNWKSDLFTIPALILKHKIDLFHYWIALGPKWQIGLGLFNPCATVATLYDPGVELWDIPFLKAVRTSRYWKMQKRLIKSTDRFICISKATLSGFAGIFPSLKDRMQTIYMPLTDSRYKGKKRDPYLITLGGSIHKNCARVVKAFSMIKDSFPHYKLLILGKIDRKEENLESVTENVFFEENMDFYHHHLTHASGLLFFSLYEGLGIPPLEAMSYGCPVAASRIPSIEETCGEAARLADPLQTEAIADAISDLIINNDLWAARSMEGASKYRELSKNSGTNCIEMYRELLCNRKHAVL
ncbi:MAG: glycosyltransferase family 4 protein [Fibrobacter sp.]|nr:glycosyltransferase family 4 protein [Fibrobacter sp.]